MLLCIAFTFSTTIKAQTALNAGDIAVLWSQTDVPDKFAFVTFVDLAAGTSIYFTDCGVTTTGALPAGACTEGAVRFVVPGTGLTKGTVVTWTATAANFTNYTDTKITGALALSTAGDQVLAFQDAANPAGSSNAAANPKFIFIMNTGSTLFTGDAVTSSTETNLPTGLVATGLPRTALGVGSGPGASDEFDNAIYKGPYTFPTVAAAKLAITNPVNYYGTDADPTGGDALYDGYATALPATLSFITLGTSEIYAENGIQVYPNPSNGNITIRNSGAALRSATILDASGKIVMRIDLKGAALDKNLNLEGQLPAGLYFLEIQSDKGTALKKLLIK